MRQERIAALPRDGAANGFRSSNRSRQMIQRPDGKASVGNSHNSLLVSLRRDHLSM